MKPKFILGSGIGWSATTPLWYSLQLDNQYLHTGHWKECGYLNHVSSTPSERFREENRERMKRGTSHAEYMRQWAKNRVEKNQEVLKKLEKNPKTLTGKNNGRLAGVLRDLYLTQEDIDAYTTPPYRLEKYITYYKRIWETLQENNCPYQAVGDFTISNSLISEDFIHKLIEKLSEDFDVKVLIIVRDPIRRLWSEVNGEWHPSSPRQWVNEAECIKFFLSSIETNKHIDYIGIIEKWERVCPTHVIIMEQLWEGDEQEREKQRLSDFLDYDIKNIHENVYSPDCGPNAPHYQGCEDQWRSDKYWLQDKLYNRVKPFFPVYQQWVDKYGGLPLYWGKPYPYEV